MLRSEVPGGATDAAADVKDGAVRGESGNFEQKANKIELGGFFTFVGLRRLRWPVAVVDVLAPRARNQWLLLRML